MEQPEEFKLTVQNKLDLLAQTGTHPITVQTIISNNICSCCGTRGERERVRGEEDGRYIQYRWRTPEQEIPPVEQNNCLLIPDAAGNLLIEWENNV